MLLLGLLLLVHLQVLVTGALGLGHRVRTLRGGDLEVVRLAKTLIWHLSECPKSEILIYLLELAVMALRPDQREVARGMLGAELTAAASPIYHLRVIVVSLGVYLMAQVLLVNRSITCLYLGTSVTLKAFHVLIMSGSDDCLFWILRRDIVVIVSLSGRNSGSLVLVHKLDHLRGGI